MKPFLLILIYLISLSCSSFKFSHATDEKENINPKQPTRYEKDQKTNFHFNNSIPIDRESIKRNSINLDQSNYFHQNPSPLKKIKLENCSESLSTSVPRNRSTRNGANILRNYPKNCSQMNEDAVSRFIDGTMRTERDYGSRCFYKQFDEEAQQWHEKQVKLLEQLYRLNHRKEFTYSPDSNFAVARWGFLDERDQLVEPYSNIPYVFVSGWPNSETKNKGNLKGLSRHLTEIDREFYIPPNKDQKALYFPTYIYRNGDDIPTRKNSHVWFQDQLKEIFRKAADKTIIHDKRRTYCESLIENINDKHRNGTHSKVDEEDFAHFYIHTEQTILLYLKDYIRNYRHNLKPKTKYLILDIVSINDMCWNCGDTLASFTSFCHTLKDFGLHLKIRISGLNGYSDIIKINDDIKRVPPLRNDSTWLEARPPSIRYNILSQPHISSPVKPYIMHVKGYSREIEKIFEKKRGISSTQQFKQGTRKL